MNRPVQVTFRDVAVSPAARERVLSRAADLEKNFQGITSCRVTVAKGQHHHRRGEGWEVRIELHVPGGDLVVDTPSDKDDLHVAVDEAFDDARKQLDTWSERQRAARKEARPWSR